ncbi:MAG: MBL fold metallo-hydrolase [Dehalococcoidia bacterium]
MEIRVTTLSENTANPAVLAEWGLSVLIELNGSMFLLDTGQGISAAHNAQLLGIDLARVNKLILSHGHYDHTGGLVSVLAQTGEIEIIAHPDMWDLKYAVYGEIQRYIGIPFHREELEGMGAKFQLTREPLWLTDLMVTSGEIPMENDYERIDAGMYVKDNGSFTPDQLMDDLALGIKSEKGLIVILGCGHRGMINTIRHMQNITGEEKVYCVLGGTHLISADEERLVRTTADLREIGVEKIGVSHCTGFNASCWLAGEFPDRFFLNNSGTVLTLP